ncbi:hypothetical protein ACIQNU_39740 [Streptomyces sp. NPDC091292]|uniref:hypothetical protein n=1 Tax=Streptomyces sp. NPDC091292 TaxID=3365991 RepID=UPI003804F6C2
MPYTQGVHGGEVFGGLRLPAFVGGDDEQHGGHGPHAGQHGGDEPLVSRDVDEREPFTRWQIRPREAQVDAAQTNPPEPRSDSDEEIPHRSTDVSHVMRPGARR